jgi:hypothetical protein
MERSTRICFSSWVCFSSLGWRLLLWVCIFHETFFYCWWSSSCDTLLMIISSMEKTTYHNLSYSQSNLHYCSIDSKFIRIHSSNCLCRYLLALYLSQVIWSMLEFQYWGMLIVILNYYSYCVKCYFWMSFSQNSLNRVLDSRSLFHWYFSYCQSWLTSN